MITRLVLMSALAALAFGAGCSADRQPLAPTAAIPQQPPTAQNATGCVFSQVAQSARVFDFAGAPGPVAQYTRCSRFVLLDNGRFELQYSGLAAYTGSYAVSGDGVDFKWDGWSAAGPWVSNATLQGNVLAVRYGVIMQMTDFDDADYRLAN